MSVSTNYLQLNNVLNSQESSQRKKSFKTIKDWSLYLQSNGSKYDGVSVPARKCAITIVGLNEGTFFSFNVTYIKQAQKACELFSETVKKYVGNANSVKIWKILPYEELYKGPSGLIDDQIKKSFPKANIDTRKLEKGYCFQVDRNGKGTQEYEPESLCEKMARSTRKCYSILSCKEDKFKF